MSACMRLPSRMGTMTLRSMMATDSSSFSVAFLSAISAVSCGLAPCDQAPALQLPLRQSTPIIHKAAWAAYPAAVSSFPALRVLTFDVNPLPQSLNADRPAIPNPARPRTNFSLSRTADPRRDTHPRVPARSLRCTQHAPAPESARRACAHRRPRAPAQTSAE